MKQIFGCPDAGFIPLVQTIILVEGLLVSSKQIVNGSLKKIRKGTEQFDVGESAV